MSEDRREDLPMNGLTENEPAQPVIAESVATDVPQSDPEPVGDSPADDETVSTAVDTSTHGYFEDDEEVLNAETVEERDFAVFPQGTNMVSWEIVGLYDTDGKQLVPNALKNEPPILRVSSADGNEAEFMMTRDFSTSMYAALDDVRRAHAGMEVKRGLTRTKQTMAENVTSFKDTVVNEPVKYGFLFFLTVLILVVLGYSLF